MRILGIGEECDLGDMYFRLAQAGHDVRVCSLASASRDVFGGMLQRVDDWRAELPWISGAGREGLILFESAVHGETQDALRSQGYRVIGGSAYGDRLEADREFGQDVLREAGLRIARSWRFRDVARAMAFVREHPARYVFKLNGAQSARTRNYVGELDNGEDVLALLRLEAARRDRATDFILMQHLEGVEVGVGAYFNGERFLMPACLDWEHKRFFAGEMGELTGEMGTIVTYRGAERIFALTLARIETALRDNGYCGYINLNLIANEKGLWPLEFTSRFGYPGYAICETLHDEGWDSIFQKMLDHDDHVIRTHPGFAAGVVLTVPPFPHSHGYAELSKGMPICFRESLTHDEHARLHFAEVELRDDMLVTSGSIGYVGVTTGKGDDVEHARDEAYALAHKLVVPNLRYRADIGERVIQHDLAALQALGYVDADAYSRDGRRARLPALLRPVAA